jgi:hypothetical protein
LPGNAASNLERGNMNKRHAVNGAMALLLVVAVVICACAPGQVVATLEAVIAAVEVALPLVMQGSGLPADQQAKITAYVSAVANATSQAAAELASADSGQVKAARVTAIFAGITAPMLPPGTAQRVVSVVASVANAVAKFLVQVQPAPMSFGARMVAVKVKVSGADTDRLSQIQKRAQVVSAQLQARK